MGSLGGSVIWIVGRGCGANHLPFTKNNTPWELVCWGSTGCRGSGLFTVCCWTLAECAGQPAPRQPAVRSQAPGGDPHRIHHPHYTRSKPGCELRRNSKVRLLFFSCFHWCLTTRFPLGTNQRRAKWTRRIKGRVGISCSSKYCRLDWWELNREDWADMSTCLHSTLIQ